MSSVLLPLAGGVEELEAVTIADVLRRAGVQVTLAGLAPGLVRGAHGVQLQPDAVWDAVAVESFDALVLPGGNGGTRALAADPRVLAAVRRFARPDKLLAAICAAPLVLQAAGVLAGRSVTAYPGVLERLDGCRRQEQAVVVDGRLVTSRGPGTALAFALALAGLLAGPERAAAVARALLCGGAADT